jgi:predicted dehydrogenase
MGSNHLRVLRDIDEERVELVGVAESHAPTLERAGRRFGVPTFSDYRAMIEHVRPDLVSVVVPTQVHFDVTMFALSQGCHVLVEKPIASTTEEALQMIALAHQQQVRLAVGHVERFNPAILSLKRHLAADQLGRIFSLHARRLGPFPPRIRDVGVILDLATHDLDAMRYLVDCDVERVYAESQQRVHQQHEDLLVGVLRFESGVVGLLDVNWLTPTKVRELTVTGERGMFLVNYLTQDLYFYENDYSPTTWESLRAIAGVSEGTMTRLKVLKSEPLRLEYEDVVYALANDTSPTVTGEDGHAVLRLAQQLIEAAKTREVVACLVANRA